MFNRATRKLCSLYNDLLYWAHSRTRTWQKEKIIEEISSLAYVDPNIGPATDEHLDSETISWISKKLRNTPYWVRGHLEFAKLSLARNDVAAAYASTQAVLLLTHKTLITEEALHLQANCYLRRGVPQKTIELLSVLVEKNQKNIRVKEDLAAAFIATGNYSDAYSMLSSIYAEQISPEAQAALSFLKLKQQ